MLGSVLKWHWLPDNCHIPSPPSPSLLRDDVLLPCLLFLTPSLVLSSPIQPSLTCLLLLSFWLSSPFLPVSCMALFAPFLLLSCHCCLVLADISILVTEVIKLSLGCLWGALDNTRVFVKTDSCNMNCFKPGSFIQANKMTKLEGCFPLITQTKGSFCA